MADESAEMIGLVLVTHGRLAEEFIAATEHVVGPQQAVRSVCIGPDDDMDRRRQEIMEAVEAVDEGDGVIVLTDMFGGTPSNLAISIMDQSNVEVIAGMNLPMLIKLAQARLLAKPLKETAQMGAEAGIKYINLASVVMEQR